MKYKGRIISLVIVVMSAVGLIVYNDIVNGYIDIMYLFVSAFFLFLGWKLGKQYDKVKYLSEKDLMTGSYNRRFMVDKFPKLKSRSDRRAQKLLIFLIDVDNFKLINVHYGHTTGDRVLQMIANALEKECGHLDYLIRWGGDEFVCVFPCTEVSELNERYLSLHNGFNKLSSRISVNVSASIGHAIYPDEGVELNDLIKIADKNMYRGKRCRNNQDNKKLVINGH
ncbi:GGDEF domain-containing protein [Paenibacillus antarcticus]|uniref:GGDEF domain-containing protein n=1 Tax=Paenibacillus antarcticus TaxID=253703 RepID=A0A168QJH9_9BACL|nr:GGDEF domain-containing protein [Paenibacillus antarcticus]OAB47854.1 hypothetical protein PBAT_02965 [Paenibacillus antarcticus]